MHTTTTRIITGLFGGTLCAAGVAHAQQFEFELRNGGAQPCTAAYAYGSDLPGIGSYDYDLTLNFAPSPAYASANYNGFGGDVVVSSEIVAAAAYSETYLGQGIGRAEGYAYFSVSSPAEILIEWDFSGEQSPFAFAYSSLSLTDWSAGGSTVFSVMSGDASSGSAQIPLTPGDRYGLDLIAVSFEFGSGVSWANATLLPAADCPADCDDNGTLNFDDIDCFVAGFLGGDLDTADLDGNGVINFDDIDAFVGSFLGGCP